MDAKLLEYSQVDYRDIFTFVVGQNSLVPERLVEDFFNQFPDWGRYLMSFRNWLVKPLGLAISPKWNKHQKISCPSILQTGDSVSFFTVLDRSASAVTLGASDTHLDGLLSFSYIHLPTHCIVAIETEVRFHNTLGKLYFFFVKPFHKLIVKALLKRMVRLYNP